MRILFTLLLSCFFFACTSVDGDEDPMLWKTNAKIKRDGYYRVVNIPAKGAEYTFTCVNYRSFHVTSCSVDGESIGHIDYLSSISKEWFTIEVEKRRFTITAQPNDTGNLRKIELNVSVGNTRTLFKFKQSI